MKILYVVFDVKSSNCEWDGVYKKILGQKKVFEQELGECDVWLVNDPNIYQMDGFRIEKEIDTFETDILKYDVAYLRMALGEQRFHRFVKYLACKNIKIYVELPTFNFAEEILLYTKKMWKQKKYEEALKGFIGMVIHKYLYFPRMLFYIDCLVTISHDKKVPFVKHINIENGIEIDNITHRKSKQPNEVLQMIVVANLCIWHGVDRILAGINKYVKETGRKDVKLTVVGTGNEEANLKKYVEDYGLEEIVIFAGKQTGEELDRYFDAADIAVSTMAFFRTGVMKSSTLKSREYCARGIPYVVTNGDWDERLAEYVYKVPDDESPLDISKIRDWYYTLIDIDSLSENMRFFAGQNYTWKKQMQVVIDAMLESIKNKK